jgi:hypothetical protein
MTDGSPAGHDNLTTVTASRASYFAGATNQHRPLIFRSNQTAMSVPCSSSLLLELRLIFRLRHPIQLGERVVASLFPSCVQYTQPGYI